MLLIIIIFQTAFAVFDDSTHLEENCALKYLKDVGHLKNTQVLPSIQSLHGVDCAKVWNMFYNKTSEDISISISERYKTNEPTTNCVVHAMMSKGFGEFLLDVKYNNVMNISFEQIEKRGDKFLFDSMKNCSEALEKLHERFLQRSVNLTSVISDSSVDLCERKFIIKSNVTTFKPAEVIGKKFNSTVNLDDINCTEILKEILKAQEKIVTQVIFTEIKLKSPKEIKCAENKIVQSDFIARTLALKQIKLAMSQDDFYLELQRFGKILALSLNASNN